MGSVTPATHYLSGHVGERIYFEQTFTGITVTHFDTVNQPGGIGCGFDGEEDVPFTKGHIDCDTVGSGYTWTNRYFDAQGNWADQTVHLDVHPVSSSSNSSSSSA